MTRMRRSLVLFVVAVVLSQVALVEAGQRVSVGGRSARIASFWRDETTTADGDTSAARDSRAIWLPSKNNPECTGGVYTMLDGDKTNLTSHKNYGNSAYPTDYQVNHYAALKKI